MSGISRRKLITRGLAAAAGACGLGVAARLADRYGLIPPDHAGIYGAGETLTYAAQKLLMSHHSLAREFNRSDISKVFPVNGEVPENETYHRLLAHGFADWRLTVDGLVAHPLALSLAELKSFPWHPQTLLAYGMNGQELPTPHGAPVRLRVARQLGYKSVKYLSRITVTDTLKNIGKGLGSISPEIGYSWYAGI